ncbi:hypothetical protein CsatB_020272 [Cannabis sativa]
MLKHFLFVAYLTVLLASTFLVQAQTQSGFISIDCGIPKNSTYTDKTTGLTYVSESDFIETNLGETSSISLEYLSDTLEQQFSTLRSFPQGDKNCYTLKTSNGKGNKFLVRARPLKNNLYTPTTAVLYRRLDVGSRSNTSIRYKDDVYDRIWQPFNFPERKVLSTSSKIDLNTRSIYEPPSNVMGTAMSPANVTSPLFSFYLSPDDPMAEYYVYMHFAELEKLQPNESRQFRIYENGEFWNGDDKPFTPKYLQTTTLSSLASVRADSSSINYDFFQYSTSTHQPILNALEVYIIQNFSEPQTHDNDVGAVLNIKSMYGVQKNWQGDPCSPKIYTWAGLDCSFSGQDSVRIISLNLSSSGLTGEIASSISDLTMIQFLDLSNNNLSGFVPEFLSELQFLKVL